VSPYRFRRPFASRAVQSSWSGVSAFEAPDAEPRHDSHNSIIALGVILVLLLLCSVYILFKLN